MSPSMVMFSMSCIIMASVNVSDQGEMLKDCHTITFSMMLTLGSVIYFPLKKKTKKNDFACWNVWFRVV